MRIVKRLVRWSVVVFCLYAAYRLFRLGTSAGPATSAAAIAALLSMFGCLILIPIVLLPDLLPIATRPFTAFIDDIFGTAPAKGRPPLNYSLARGYLRQNRREEALIGVYLHWILSRIFSCKLLALNRLFHITC